MASAVHEILVDVLKQPHVLSDLLAVAVGRRVRGAAPRAVDASLAESKPVERRPDVLMLGGNPAEPRGWVMVEVQVSIDPDKLRSIPLELELARARYPNVPGDIVLVTTNGKTARFFDRRHPFRLAGRLGTCRTLEVVRVDLSRVPPERLLVPRRPHLALFAVAAHRSGKDAEAVARRALDIAAKSTAQAVQGASRMALVDAILDIVGVALRRRLEAHMQQHGLRTKFLRDAYDKGEVEGEAKGEARGKADGLRTALLHVLAKRRIKVPPKARARIDSETEPATLERWHDAALTATAIAEVFADN